jgi:hypothetical protein
MVYLSEVVDIFEGAAISGICHVVDVVPGCWPRGSVQVQLLLSERLASLLFH